MTDAVSAYASAVEAWWRRNDTGSSSDDDNCCSSPDVEMSERDFRGGHTEEDEFFIEHGTTKKPQALKAAVEAVVVETTESSYDADLSSNASCLSQNNKELLENHPYLNVDSHIPLHLQIQNRKESKSCCC
jgi:hypothetical protein